MVTGPSARVTEVPDSAPWVTTSLVGTPRLFFGCLAGRAGRGTATVCRAWGVRGPVRSDRITETVVNTNSHSTARKPSRMTVMVSSDTAGLFGRLAEDELGVAD